MTVATQFDFVPVCSSEVGNKGHRITAVKLMHYQNGGQKRNSTVFIIFIV